MEKHSKVGLVAGSIVFVVNMAENIFHYSIGKQNGNGNGDGRMKLYMPTPNEFGKMIITSLVAGVIVGFVTRNISK
jgi:hypothetical protein